MEEWPHGEVAFVTGAASGIGLGITKALVKAGAKVAMTDINAEVLRQEAGKLTAQGFDVLAVPLDVSAEKDWAAAAELAQRELGEVSILVGNAGVNGGGPIDQTSFEIWRWVMGINADAQFLGLQTFLSKFKALGRRAHIMMTGSMASLYPIPNAGAYVASNFARFGLANVLRAELKGTDVGVTVLLPGAVNTNISKNAAAAEAKLLGTEVDEEAVARKSAATASGADPEAVGQQVLEAMQARQFLVITHKEWWPLVERIHDEQRDTFLNFDGRHGVDQTALMLAAGGNPLVKPE